MFDPALSPADIEKTSLSIIDAEVPEPRPFAGDEWAVVRRMIHASADFELLSLTRFHPRALSLGLAALRSGCLLVTDTEMAKAGIPMRRLAPLKVKSLCFVGDPGVAALAKSTGRTRASHAVDKALAQPGKKIFVIGNAPTALLRLLDAIDRGAPVPELVVGMPVGFVNAAEAKEMLLARPDIASIVVTGRKGGTTLAAAAVNALAELALASPGQGEPS